MLRIGVLVVMTNKNIDQTDTPRLRTIDPRLLSEHPKWRELHDGESIEVDEDTIESVREGQTTVLITGEGCASGPNVILHSHVRWSAAKMCGVKEVAIVPLNDLSAEAEETKLIQSSLRIGGWLPYYKPSRKAALEARLFDLYRREPGLSTTPLDRSAGKGATLAAVAQDTLIRPSGVTSRRKVFSSPVSPKALRDDLDSGAFSLSTAVKIVRYLEAHPRVQEARAQCEAKGVPAMDHPDVIAVYAKLVEKPLEIANLEGAFVNGVLVAEGCYLGYPTRVEVNGSSVRLVQLKST